MLARIWGKGGGQGFKADAMPIQASLRAPGIECRWLALPLAGMPVSIRTLCAAFHLACRQWQGLPLLLLLLLDMSHWTKKAEPAIQAMLWTACHFVTVRGAAFSVPLSCCSCGWLACVQLPIIALVQHLYDQAALYAICSVSEMQWHGACQDVALCLITCKATAFQNPAEEL